MEAVKNDEAHLTEDDGDDSDESEEEEAEADAGIAPLVARSEESSGAKQSTVVVGETAHRSLSRTPSPSPSLTARMAATLHLNDIKDIVSSDLTKERARQQRKYHSKKRASHAGRPQGSKAKLDTRIKMDRGGISD